MRTYEHRMISESDYGVWYVSEECTKPVNKDKPDYLQWIADGNTPEVIPYVPPTPPTPTPTEDLRMQAFAKSATDLDTLIAGGFPFTYEGQSYTFDTKASSREKLSMAYFIALANPSYTQKMIMKDGVILVLGAADIIAKYNEMLAYGAPMYSDHADLFESIKTMTREQLIEYLNI